MAAKNKEISKLEALKKASRASYSIEKKRREEVEQALTKMTLVYIDALKKLQSKNET